jgi:hypothetical protein
MQPFAEVFDGEIFVKRWITTSVARFFLEQYTKTGENIPQNTQNVHKI